jgi:uncharacterized membrane protein SirB2
MNPFDFYPVVKPFHIALAAASVSLFASRGLGVLAGQAWPMARPLRRLVIAIDTALLAAGVTLWWMLSLHPLRQGWFAVKLALLVVYIVLGSLALRRARTPARRALALALALGCIAAVASIALAHDARAPLRWLGSRF